MAESSNDANLMSRALSDLGTAYMDLGDLENAENYILKSLPLISPKLEKDHGHTYGNLGIVYMQQGKLDKAIFNVWKITRNF